jgi:hypothetical protein
MRDRIPKELIRLNRIARCLAETRSLKAVKAIRDKAEAARHYARGAALGLQIQNKAAELKLLAERRAGQLLTEIVAHGGDHKSSSHRDNLKLSDLGISHNQSSRWQRVAAVPEEVFRRYIADSTSVGREITTQGFLRLWQVLHGKSMNRYAGGTGYGTTVGSFSGSQYGETVPELLDEIDNHRSLLQQILSSIVTADNASISLPLAQQRIVLRLLHDIKTVLDCLRTRWQSVPTSD